RISRNSLHSMNKKGRSVVCTSPPSYSSRHGFARDPDGQLAPTEEDFRQQAMAGYIVGFRSRTGPTKRRLRLFFEQRNGKMVEQPSRLRDLLSFARRCQNNLACEMVPE